jgi:cell division protein FtsI/penicillin-binding protein 2
VPLIARRIGLLFALFFGLLAVAGARTAYFATIKGGTLKRAATTQQVAELTIPARRGTIVDDRGVELAVSQAASDVSATPYPLLGKPEDQVVRSLARRDTGFVYLARALPADQAQKIADLDIAGIALAPTTRRTYPRDWLASQLLGSVGVDGAGLSGLEYSFDRVLRGRDGKRRIVKDALGQAISVDDLKLAKPGAKLELSLDAAVQGRAEQVLGQIGAKYKPKGATAVVMNPNTGELLAVANWPRIDANAPTQAPVDARQDRAVSFTYEPGSTFKAVTVAGALQDKVVTPDTMFDLAPQIQVADRTIGEAEVRGPIRLSTAGILAQSSNVGAITIGLREGADAFARWVDRFGFGRPTGVDLPGEEKGIVLPRAQYSGSSMGNLPIGQGTSVTPMQIATAYSAIANGGKLVTPHVVRRVGGRTVSEPAAKRVISAATAAQLRIMLKGVLQAGGTASEVSIPGYQLAGKTGTANKVDPKTGLYSQSKYVASFVGFAPALKPKLLVSVMVDEPQGDIFGGSVAAPAFGQIMSFALSYLNIPPG